jgi:Flp pilus assembly protein TadG
MYALCLLAVMILVGFAVDFRRMQLARSHLQDSLDAAVLAAAREFLMLSAQPLATRRAAADAVAQDYFQSNLLESAPDLTGATLTISFPETGEIEGAASVPVELAFGGLIGRDYAPIAATGAAMAGDGRKIEVVLALDNTTSMFASNRFTLMRDAAKGFVNTMFDETPAEGLTAISVIPWSTLVNINSEQPAGWVPAAVAATTPPAAGTRLVPPAPFENRLKYLLRPEQVSAYTAAQMAADFAPVGWRGCIRAAPNERSVSNSGSVGASLTDAPVSGMRWHAALVEPELQRRWVNETPPKPPPPPKPPAPPKPPKPKPPSPPPAPPPPPSPPPPPPPPPPAPPPGPQGFLDGPFAPEGYDFWSKWAGIPISPVRATYYVGWVSQCSQDSRQGGVAGLRNVHMPVTQDCSNNSKKAKTGTINACVSDPNEIAYLNGGGAICPWQNAILPWNQWRPVSGPNMLCPTSMLGLSQSRAQIISKLDLMFPVPGGTQADIGLMWGLRALSPRTQWVNFFGHTGINAPRAFHGQDVRKIMILLTDGQNESPWHFEGYYGCSETSDRGQAGACWRSPSVQTLNQTAMDNLMLDACEAIVEDYGVELYTIAVDVTNATAITLLRNCAGDPDRAFNITAGELDQTFQSIAERELRLTR